MPTVRVEFYGLARSRAGTATVTVTAATVGEALEAVAVACPGLQMLRAPQVSPHYLVALGGERFATNPDRQLVEGDSLLVLGADAGG